MKQLFFTILTLWLRSSTALAEPLSQPDKDYVVLGLAAVRVITECPDYKGIPDAIRKLADQIGVDPAVVSAVGQVVRMGSGRDYDGSLLIPEVTQLMNDTDDWLNRELNEDRTRFCKRWGDALSEKGLIQRKSEEAVAFSRNPSKPAGSPSGHSGRREGIAYVSGRGEFALSARHWGRPGMLALRHSCGVNRRSGITFRSSRSTVTKERGPVCLGDRTSPAHVRPSTDRALTVTRMVVDALVRPVIAAGHGRFEVDDPRVRLRAVQFVQCAAPNVGRPVASRNSPVRLLGEQHVTLRRSYVFFINLGAAGMRQHLVDAAAAHDISA